MKIESGSIVMASSHDENHYTYKETASINALASKGATAVILNISKEGEGKKITEAMAEYSKRDAADAAKRQKENQQNGLRQMARQLRLNTIQANNVDFELPQESDDKIEMLRQILAILRGEKYEPKKHHPPKQLLGGGIDLRTKFSNEQSFSFKSSFTVAGISSGNTVNIQTGGTSIPQAGTSRGGTVWQNITATYGFESESEFTTFASKGIVNTADGRSIDFNIEVSMSRAFTAEIGSISSTTYVITDPLMINLDTNAPSVTDQKFYFDIDSDGKEDRISFAGAGSGFLALDKNGDGKINDGSELFGTKSGDGFADLTAYDIDKNGWIDENDAVYNKLRVWTKDENGNDHLLNLKEADVGAIYLGNVDTQFSLTDDMNATHAEIKKTGVFLHESTGLAGTLNHVDLAV